MTTKNSDIFSPDSRRLNEVGWPGASPLMKSRSQDLR